MSANNCLNSARNKPFSAALPALILFAVCLLAGCQGACNRGPVANSSSTGTQAAKSEPVPNSDGARQEATPANGQSAAQRDSDAPLPATPEAPEAPDSEGVAAAGADTAGAQGEAAGVAEASEEPPRRGQRFIVCAPERPWLVELLMTVDGATLEEQAERLLREKMADLDQDGDEQLSWEELTASSLVRDGYDGNRPLSTPAEREQLQQRYERTGDSLVNADELLRVLSRDRGGQGAFMLRAVNHFRGDNQSRSPVRLLLDENQDGALDEREMEGAAERLRRRDPDGDDMIEPSDLAPRVDADDRMRQVRRAVPDIACRVDAESGWNHLLSTLQEHYCFGDELTTDSLQVVPPWLARLDADQDGTITREELPGLLDATPDLLVQAKFGEGEPSLAATYDAEPDAVWTVHQTAPVQLHFGTPNERLAMLVRDAGAGEAPELSRAQQVFTALDRDANGYLDEDEAPNGLPGVATSFAALDVNEDKKIFPDEVRALIERQLSVSRCQVSVLIRDDPDALFQALDEDQNQRLTSRELDGMADRLRSLDRDGNGQLWPHEIPAALTLVVQRGGQTEILRDFPMLASPVPSEQGPDWFRQMDVNGDGEVARREFLGKDQQFAELDRDGDGYLHPSEVGGERTEPTSGEDQPEDDGGQAKKSDDQR